MQFRIGINLGDVIEEGDRIYGDGVNIAARLESLAILEESAYQKPPSTNRNEAAFGYHYLGSQTSRILPAGWSL